MAIDLLFRPRQCRELNPVGRLWREVRRTVSANCQFPSIDDHAQVVEDWIMGLSRPQTRRKVEFLSKNFWVPTLRFEDN